MRISTEVITAFRGGSRRGIRSPPPTEPAVAAPVSAQPAGIATAIDCGHALGGVDHGGWGGGDHERLGGGERARGGGTGRPGAGPSDWGRWQWCSDRAGDGLSNRWAARPKVEDTAKPNPPKRIHGSRGAACQQPLTSFRGRPIRGAEPPRSTHVRRTNSTSRRKLRGERHCARYGQRTDPVGRWGD